MNEVNDAFDAMFKAMQKTGDPYDYPNATLVVIEECKKVVQSLLESLEKDAARYREYKENSHIRFSLFSGRYRADNGFSVLTDWIESFDDCFDSAMQANKGE